MTARSVSHKEIAESLKEARKVAIFGHVSPDSDCYGSTLSLMIALESLGKEAFVYLPDEFPYYLTYLKNHNAFKQEKDFQFVDAAVIMDSSSVNRVVSSDVLARMKEKNIPIYLVDHHISGDLSDFADYAWQDNEISSVSEMVLEIIKDMGVKIKKDIATLLLSGIEGDTGSFQHQNTTQNSLKDAAYLMLKGARFKSIIDNAFNSKKEINIIKIYGLVLERLIYNKKYQTATTYITLADMDKYGIGEESGSGIINFLNIIEGVKMVVLITEMDDNAIKVSLRTSDENVDVQKLASYVGGGGHVKASGFTVKGKIIVENGQVQVA